MSLDLVYFIRLSTDRKSRYNINKRPCLVFIENFFRKIKHASKKNKTCLRVHLTDGRAKIEKIGLFCRDSGHVQSGNRSFVGGALL
jgi:hypothetical protein